MHQVQESSKASQNREPTLLKQERYLLYFFTLDKDRESAAKTIKWITIRAVIIAIVLVLGYFTAKTTWPLLEDYKLSPTSFHATTVTNYSIALPLSTICLPLSPFELDRYMVDQQQSSTQITHYQKLLAAFFDSTTKESFLSKETRWPNSLLFVVSMYLSLIMQFESPVGNKAIEYLNTLNASTNDLSTAIFILDDQMKVLNISTTELTMKYGNEIKMLFGLRIILTMRSSGETAFMVVDSILSSIETDSSHCFTARFDQHPLREGESILIQAQRSHLPNPRPNNPQPAMTIGIGGKLSDGQYDVLRSSLFNSFVTSIPLQVASSFRSIPNRGGKQRCSVDKTLDTCTSECRRYYIRERCGCFPTFGYTQSVYGEKVCGMRDYLSCFQEANKPEEQVFHEHLTRCEDSCLDICQRTTYTAPEGSSYEYSSGATDAANGQSQYAMIELKVANFGYTIYEEIFKWTYTSFLGALGVALGLLLGINVLDIIMYPIIGIKLLIQACGRKASDTANTHSSLKQSQNIDIRSQAGKQNALSNAKSMEADTSMRSDSKVGGTFSKWINPINITWLLVFTALIGLTVKLTNSMISEYLSSYALTTTAAYINYQTSMALPKATVCFPLVLGELDSTSNIFQQENLLASQLTNYLNQQSLTKDDFLPAYRHWDNTVRNVAHIYLIQISYFEVGDGSPLPGLNMNEDLMAALDILEKIISKLSISVDELRQSFGHEVAELYSLLVSVTDHSEMIEMNDAIRTTFIGYDQICYEMPFNLYPLRSTSSITITLSAQSLPNPSRFGFSRGQIMVDFANPLFTASSSSDSVARGYFGETSSIPIVMTAYRSLPQLSDDMIRCSYMTKDQCEALCRIQFIEDQCKCQPTSWPSLLNYFKNGVTDTCDLKQYNACPKMSEEKNMVECLSQCVRPCEKLTVSIQNIAYSQNERNTMLRLYFKDMRMTIYEEQLLSRNYGALLVTVGGIFRFLLGYGFAEIISLVLIFFIRLFAACFKKEETAPRRKSQIATIAVHPLPNFLADEVESSEGNLVDHKTNGDVRKKNCRSIINLQWTMENIVTLIVIAFFGWLTVKACLPIVRDYQEGRTMAVMSLALNAPLYLKPATICITLYPNELSMHSGPANYENEIQNFFNQQGITKEMFLDGGMHFTNSVRYVAYIYLSLLSSIETATGQTRYDLTLPSSTDSTIPQFFKSSGDDLYRSMVLFEKYMNALNISSSELRQRVGLELAAIFSIRALQNFDAEEYIFMPIREVTAITTRSVCYQLPLDRYPFYNTKQRIVVTANSNFLPNKLLTDSQRTMELYLQGTNKSELVDQLGKMEDVLSSSFASQSSYSIAVSARYLAIASLGRCSKDKTSENCLVECRIALFQKMCKCTPATWSSWAASASYPECKLSNYTACANYGGSDDADCVKQHCSAVAEMCDRSVLDVRPLQASPSHTGATIALQPSSFDYPIYREQYKYSSVELFSAVGKIVLIYLGFHIFKIVIFIGKVIAGIKSLIIDGVIS